MPERDESGGMVKKKKPLILVCEDEAGLRSAMGLALEGDYALCFAADGEEALAAYDRQPADLVLLDIKMPKKDGLEVLQKLMTRTPAPRVVILTAYQSAELAQWATQSGALDYVTKPFQRDTLVHAVERALRRAPPPPAPCP